MGCLHRVGLLFILETILDRKKIKGKILVILWLGQQEEVLLLEFALIIYPSRYEKKKLNKHLN
jgi:hypothetical protein